MFLSLSQFVTLDTSSQQMAAAGVDLMVELCSAGSACSSSALLCWLAAPFLREISETDLASRRAAAVGGESQYRTVRRHTCFGDMTEPNGYMASSQSRTFFSNAFAFIGSHGTNMYIIIKQTTKPSEKNRICSLKLYSLDMSAMPSVKRFRRTS